MVKIKNGGLLISLKRHLLLKEIKADCKDGRIVISINDTHISALSVEEALCLRDELNEALRLSANENA